MLDVTITVFAIAIVSLSIAAIQDMRSREIDKFIFIPLVLVGFLGGVFNGVPLSLLILPVVLFISLFVKFVPWIYAVIGVAGFALSFHFSPPGYFLEISVVFLIYMMGIGEKLFGYGDVKALLALSVSFYTPIIYSIRTPTYIESIFPFDFSLLFTLSLVSLLSVIYILLLSFLSGDKISLYSLFSFNYDEEKLKKNPNKYRVREIGGKKIMVYGIPFIVPILISFILVSFLGSWYVL